jgi:hypothetical protein
MTDAVQGSAFAMDGFGETAFARPAWRSSRYEYQGLSGPPA